MAHDIFISHAMEDKAAANAVRAALEAQGIRCQTAGNAANENGENAVMAAIKDARLVLLIFSENSNRSSQIRFDVERAGNFRIPVIPLRVQNVAPTASLDYFIVKAGTKGRLPIEEAASSPENFLQTPHWLDAFTLSPEKQIQFLAQILRQILGKPAVEKNEPQASAPEIKSAFAPSAVAEKKPERNIPQTFQTYADANPDGGSSPKPVGSSTLLLAVTIIVSVVLVLVVVGWLVHSGILQKELANAKNEAAQANQAAQTAQNAQTAQAAELAQARAALQEALTNQEVRATQDATKPQIRIVPDEYQTIQSAIDAANEGDVVKVKAGIYTENLTFREGVQLIGAGADLVTVQSSSTNNTLDCENVQSGLIEGFTFQHTDKNQEVNRNPVVYFGECGAVEMTACLIRASGGNGVSVNNSTAKITECVMRDNSWGGIRVSGTNSRPVISHNEISDNAENGMYVCDGAHGDIRENVCENNAESGISVYDAGTAPVLTANRCINNTMHGIDYVDGSAGYAEDNICTDNKECGILANGIGTAPELKANECRGNQESGIYFGKNASGTATANVCEDNKWCGIIVDGTGTSATLKDNQCRANQQHGIDYQNGASGEADENVCDENILCGLLANGSGTNPRFKYNQCRHNSHDGIEFYDSAGGDVENNICENNLWSGISVYANSGPTLTSNTCHNNSSYGIWCQSGASAQMNSNETSGNIQGEVITDGTTK